MPEPSASVAKKNDDNYLKLNKLTLTKLYNYCFFQVKELPGDFLTDGAHLIPRPSLVEAGAHFLPAAAIREFTGDRADFCDGR
jgi:hypothetical protein